MYFVNMWLTTTAMLLKSYFSWKTILKTYFQALNYQININLQLSSNLDIFQKVEIDFPLRVYDTCRGVSLQLHKPGLKIPLTSTEVHHSLNVYKPVSRLHLTSQTFKIFYENFKKNVY